jgi:hypothetical protein
MWADRQYDCITGASFPADQAWAASRFRAFVDVPVGFANVSVALRGVGAPSFGVYILSDSNGAPGPELPSGQAATVEAGATGQSAGTPPETVTTLASTFAPWFNLTSGDYYWLALRMSVASPITPPAPLACAIPSDVTEREPAALYEDTNEFWTRTGDTAAWTQTTNCNVYPNPFGCT